MTHDVRIISEDDHAQRLDRWLKQQRPDLPYGLIQKLLRKGQVRVDGKRAKPDQRLIAGQQVRMPLGADEDKNGGRSTHLLEKNSEWLRQFLIHEDDDLLVFNKPSGLAVQGGSGLKFHLEMLMDGFIRHGITPRLVHRLDRETSGVLVMARTARAARRMGDQFTNREVKKTYWALVRPGPVDDKGLIDAPLDKMDEGTDLEKMQVVDGGQSAQTEYRVLGRHAQTGVTAVAFYPLTGRTHQIRVHAAYSGFPLIGDKKYGGDLEIIKEIKGVTRVHLHAAELMFTHPGTGKIFHIMAPLPDDLKYAWQAFNFKEDNR